MNAENQSLPHVVDAIIDHPAHLLSAGEAAGLIGRSVSVIQEACKLTDGRGIEAISSSVRGRGRRQCWRIGKAELLRYVWTTTRGDKAMLRDALARRSPALLRFLQAQEPCAEAAPLPANAIPFTVPTGSANKRRSRAQPHAPDPFAGHPDLFATA